MNIGIVGKMGSGKDTVADYLVENYGYKKVSFAEPMRDIVKYILGISDKTDPRYRPAMQELGSWGRKYSPDCWVKAMLNDIDFNDEGITVVQDVRQPNEAKALLEAGWLLIYLNCSRDERKRRCLERDGVYDEATERHESELGVDKILELYGQELIWVNAGLQKINVFRWTDCIIDDIKNGLFD